MVEDMLNYAIEQGHGNYQGDMMLTADQYKQIVLGKRGALSPVNYWPRTGRYVNIPVVNTARFSKYEKAHIARAFTEFDKHTCIR